MRYTATYTTQLAASPESSGVAGQFAGIDFLRKSRGDPNKSATDAATTKNKPIYTDHQSSLVSSQLLSPTEDLPIALLRTDYICALCFGYVKRWLQKAPKRAGHTPFFTLSEESEIYAANY
jgi:hypothetical protein